MKWPFSNAGPGTATDRDPELADAGVLARVRAALGRDAGNGPQSQRSAASDIGDAPMAESLPGHEPGPESESELEPGPGPQPERGARPKHRVGTGGFQAAMVASARSAGHAGRTLWRDWAVLRPFAATTLAPVPLLVIAAFWGGLWALAAVLVLTALVYALDRILVLPDPVALSAADRKRADRLCIALALLHFILLLVAVFALSGGSELGFFAWIGVFVSFGLWFGQVSNSNAHELIHRTQKPLFYLGMAVFTSVLFGHHTSAHRLVHHRYVATTDDPNTAAQGESFYAFAPRAWWQALVAGYEMENQLRQRRGAARGFDLHPYAVYIGGGFLGLVVIETLFGGWGLLAYLALCAYAQLQLHLSDYVQHYGLLRQKMPDGSLEPVGPGHSWNAAHPVSARMMLNAPLHSDHHSHPARPFPALTLPAKAAAPELPYALPVMGALALLPRLWFGVMDPRLAAWRPDRWSRPIR